MTEFTRLGKYHVLERLAASRLAEIYKVKTVGIAGFEKIQVLSRILPAHSKDTEFLKAFIAEAKVAFSLNHRNIVQVFEFGKVDGELFLATEYIPGVNLRSILRGARSQGRPLPTGLACYTMAEVAAGLDYAHRKTDENGQPLEIAHGDLAPYNVACSWEGSVKVLDFGISRAAWLAAAHEDRYRGLPTYLSPEQARHEPPTTASDIYTIGIMLWESLAGRPLVEATDARTAHSATLEEVRYGPREHNPQVPIELDALTLRCLQQDPGRRIESANRLQVELHRIQRQLGAVIGSRSLATFLHELFPERNDSRDVRQEEAGEYEEGEQESDDDPSIERSPTRRRAVEASRLGGGRRLPDLVDAARELAEPRNPPPLAAAATPGLRRPRINARIHTDAHAAGVLRSVRDPDEAPALHHPQTGEGFSAAHDERWADRDPKPGQPSRESVPVAELLEVGGPATGSSELFDEITTSRQSSSAAADAAPDTTPELSPLRRVLSGKLRAPRGALRQVDSGLTEADFAATGTAADPAERGRAEASVLGEKKRFIAVAVEIDGDDDRCREAIQLVHNIAFKLDGILHQQSDRGAVVLFGLPLADENDTVAAVRFVVDVLDAVGRSTGPATEDAVGQPLAVRAGIRAGSARMGVASSASYQVLGNSIADTVDLAEHAPAGMVYLAGAAARLASIHYALQEVKQVRRRGKPVRCHKLLGPTPKHRRHDQADPLIGREMELRSLRAALREVVLAPAQRTVLVFGDAGLGKSRLLDEFLHRHAGDARAITAAATPHQRNTAYGVVLDLLRAITGVSGTSSPRSRQRMMERLGAAVEHIPNDQRAELLASLNILIDPALPTGTAPQDARFRMLHSALGKLLLAMAQREALIVAVEDLHWSDHASMECLRALAQRFDPAGVPLLLVLTARPLEDDETLFAEGAVSTITVEELDAAQRQQLITAILGARATPELVSEIEKRAQGNPFYIRELAAAAREMEANALSDIPQSVRGVIAARVDRFGSQVKVVLQHAAAIGPTFREGVLTQLLSRNPSRSLADLRLRGVLVPGVTHTQANSGMSEQYERQWAFRHVVLQEVIYDSLSSSDRRELHAKVAEIMLRRTTEGSSDTTAEIARHLEGAGDLARAVEYYLRAAQGAAASYANREALRLYNRALRLGPTSDEQRYRILSGRERMLGRLGHYERQLDDLRALRALCGKDPRRRADLKNRSALRLLRVGEFYQALEAAEQAEVAASEADDMLLRGEALRLRGEAYHKLDDYPRAEESVRAALALFDDHQAPTHEIRARIGMGAIMLGQARYDEALDHYRPALELIRQTNNRWLERVLRSNLAVVNLCLGHYSSALDEAQSSLQLCIEFGDLAREGDNNTIIGILYRELGAFDFADRHLRRALTIHEQTGSRWSEADTLVYFGLLHSSLGSHDAAVELLTNAKAAAQQMDARSIEVSAGTALALALLERKHHKDADWAHDEAKTALELAKGANILTGEIPSLSRAARAKAQLGDLAAARGLSRRAIELLASKGAIDGPEEEIYYTHYRILTLMNDPSSADFLAKAHAGLQQKVERIRAPEHRESFQKDVRLNVYILRDFRRSAATGSHPAY